MAELRKKINSGWVLMDAIVNQSNGSIDYYLERAKCCCIVRVNADGTGKVYKRAAL